MKRFVLIYALMICFFCSLVAQEKPMVVIVPSYNNSTWYERNLDSIMQQKYENFRVIYIDDCSSDGMSALVQARLNNDPRAAKVTYIRNANRRGALANLYSAIHSCKNEEIVVLVDGDDWFAHSGVLARVNAEYANPEVWLTYGQFQVFPDQRVGENKEIPQGVIIKNVFREYDWCTTHLRTFYAGLFKQVKLEDLLYRGAFFDVTWDMAFMFPMLEMSAGHFRLINDVLYMYNCGTQNNDFKTKLVSQIHCDKVIRARDKYTPLSFSPYAPSQSVRGVSVLLFSENAPAYAELFLETLASQAQGFADIHVVYQADVRVQSSYHELTARYPHVRFYYAEPGNTKSVLMHVVSDLENGFVLLARDGVVFKTPVDLCRAAQQVQSTQAIGFYCALGKNITHNVAFARAQRTPPMVNLNANSFAWQFSNGEGDWGMPYALHGVVVKKSLVLSQWADLSFDGPVALMYAWEKLPHAQRALGLCAEQSSVCIIKQDGSQLNPTKAFEERLKFDSTVFAALHNNLVRFSYRMPYVQR